jgi:hypothetical protein
MVGHIARDPLPAHLTLRREWSSQGGQFAGGRADNRPYCQFPSSGVFSPNTSSPTSVSVEARAMPDCDTLEINRARDCLESPHRLTLSKEDIRGRVASCG